MPSPCLRLPGGALRSFAKSCRTMFHELRVPPPVALTINQRKDWPLTDLERSPFAQSGSVSGLNSLELTRHAERLLQRRAHAEGRRSGRRGAGEWAGVASRFAELCSQMDIDLCIRLLRCFARAKYTDGDTLQSLVRNLSTVGKTPSNLTCLSSALLSLREALGEEEVKAVFRRFEDRALEHSKEAWGLSSPLMLANLVGASSFAKVESDWSSARSLLVGAVAQHAGRMGPMHLEISAYACARLQRSCKDPAGLQQILGAATVLLDRGTNRATRFLPRGLLNFFVAMERLLGPSKVSDLALSVARRLQRCVPEDLEGCTGGDRYRSALCLLRACRAERSPALAAAGAEALAILLGENLSALPPHAMRALAARIQDLGTCDDAADWSKALKACSALVPDSHPQPDSCLIKPSMAIREAVPRKDGTAIEIFRSPVHPRTSMELVGEKASVGESKLILVPKTGQNVALADGALADVSVKFNSALPGGLAFWLEVGGSPSTPMNCFEKVPTEPYVWRSVPEGNHVIRAVLWKTADSSMQPKSKEDLEGAGPFEVTHAEKVDFFVHRPEDFNPSYDWRKVEPWHRLPEGLEISMNLQEGGSQARIPQPWHWEPRVVGQEERQRVAVNADTTMSDVLQSLGLSDSTHEVVWCQESGKHERVLQSSWTAAQADLFRYQKQIVVRRFATLVD
ncbi:unnamed protein product [Symbiodinium necroappetens]|uniref:Uncharacterized protein n=1 Tax=Symbiodinium necroappetens TaxID=1628268 RepID=A0A813CJM2_9DINO|nr:unnamed protein product [Symbiodinium necroappetens]